MEGGEADPGTALVHVPRCAGLFSAYVMLPDGSVRRPLDAQDWLFWKMWSMLLGWNLVAETIVGDMRVSTVFLGIDHDHMTGHEIVVRGPSIDDWEFVAPIGYIPLVFETMIFGGVCHLAKWRYRTLRMARFGHKRAVLKARSDWAELNEEHHDDDAIPPL